MGFAWFLMQVTDAAVLQDSPAVWWVLYFGIGLTIAIGPQTYESAILRKKADSGLQRGIKKKYCTIFCACPSAGCKS